MPVSRLSVVHQENRTELVGLEGFVLCQMGNSVVGCIQRASTFLGQPISYAELMGRSGQAFRVQVHEEFCPSAPHSACGVPTLSRLWQTAPIRPVPVLRPGETLPESELRARVREAIDAGDPLLYHSEETGLIAGYMGDGRPWICLHPYAWHANRFEETNLPWSIDRAVVRDEPIDPHTTLVESLHFGLALWNHGPVQAYLTGRPAYQHWIERVAHASPEAFARLSHGAYWTYAQLREARAAAAAYLDAHQAFPEVAAAWRRAAEALAAGGLSPEAVATPAWATEHPASPESRARYADVLATARDHDTAAFALLRAALPA